MPGYVHGYDGAANDRLNDQAKALSDRIHGDVRFGEDELVLEVGCGVGSQTAMLAANNPKTRFVASDISEASLETAQTRLAASSDRVRFQRADINALPFKDNMFDHAFICFVLEHLPDPSAALQEVARVTRPGGTLTVIEGDHGSVLIYPESEDARAAIACQVALQAKSGGNAMIGRSLYPLMVNSGLIDVSVAPRLIYADGGHPTLAEDFTCRTFTEMIAGVRQDALNANMIDDKQFDRGIAALRKAAGPKGTFSYTFFRGFGAVPKPQFDK
ncbi:MAG: methyltransferase domain-containing protein [Pseudomonadota bacterium]